MGQVEILEYLRKERIKGNDGFISAMKIKNDLSKSGENPQHTHTKLLKLYNYGYLEIDVQQVVKGKPWMGHHKKYRIKKKYI